VKEEPPAQVRSLPARAERDVLTAEKSHGG
jgi:hypothetical protein